MDFEKKDCWAMIWNESDPLSLAIMEKSRLHVIRDVTPDDPIPSDAFICKYFSIYSYYFYSYVDLKIRGIFLDDIMRSPDGILR